MYCSTSVRPNKNFSVFKDFNDFDLFDSAFFTKPELPYSFVENEDSYLLAVDLPGVRKEDLSIEVEKGIVKLAWKRQEKFNIKNKNGEQSRQWILPENIKEDSIEANLEDGVLSMIIPKHKEERTVRKIAIKGSDKNSNEALGNETSTCCR